MLPDLNRLNVFYHVFRYNSFKKAAEKLFLTQPGVSQHIRKLEAEIHTPLFIRQHKKTIPTRSGKRLFKLIKPYIETLQDQIPVITMPMRQPFGKLRVGAPLEFGKRYLPAICSDFRKKWTGVTFKINFEEPDRLIAMLERNDVDMAIIDFFSANDQFPKNPERLDIKPLSAETFVLACSRRYFEQKMNKTSSYDMIAKQDFLTDEHEPVILKHWFWHYFGKTPERINIVMAIESHPALLDCIDLDMGLAVTARHLIEKKVKNNKVVTIHPTDEQLINRLSLVQIREKPLTVTEETFQNFLVNRLKDRIL